MWWGSDSASRSEQARPDLVDGAPGLRSSCCPARTQVPSSRPPCPLSNGPFPGRHFGLPNRIMAKVTRLLDSAAGGDPDAAAELLPLVYDELRRLAAARLAREKPGQTLQATALVHEAYLRLVGSEQPVEWEGRGHFFAAAAEAMRRILINRARDKGRHKRGGSWQRVDLDRLLVADQASEEELVAIDDALQELGRSSAPCAELVKLRFFTGLTLDEAAAALGIAPRTAKRYWAFSRAWLYDALRPE